MADEDACVSCPICMERYSDIRYPIVAPNCGHSICIDCGKKRKSSICVSCTVESFRFLEGSNQPWSCNEWNKNFSLLDLIGLYHESTENEKREKERLREEARREMQTANEAANRKVEVAERAREKTEKELRELKRKCERELPNDVDYMACSLCHTKERKERMKICVTCANEGKVELRKDGEEKINPFMYCSYCTNEEHSGHTIMKLQQLKVDRLLESAVGYGEAMVEAMNEQQRNERRRGEELMREWREQIQVFRRGIGSNKLDLDTVSNIELSLKSEADTISKANAEALPTFLKMQNSMKDSVTRVKRLSTQISGEGNEAVMVAAMKEENKDHLPPPPKRGGGRRRIGH